HDGNAHDFTAGCVWIATGDASSMMNNSNTAKGVGDAYALTNYPDGERRLINMRGQRVAYADCADIDDTRFTTKEMRLKVDTFFALRGVPWTPQFDEAALDIDTVRGLT